MAMEEKCAEKRRGMEEYYSNTLEVCAEQISHRTLLVFFETYPLGQQFVVIFHQTQKTVSALV